ncbi:50S ribosomal protein L6 [Candidatus Cyrtobacter comes]|uniref:50S ribosomal protein L6 n=1 Tax=Candidatus Cyrtobacter comes TaxID=675776 RepID=A0ABU5L6R0_9RICK|nr:50S ribosomal protein L6 [Candidatus Cyrtobacter comes]MDZ5761737.1 50S ribosomal protein L6 [Candidatus Cyrtobacter comes]
MSRTGKAPIALPSAVSLSVSDKSISVSGPIGSINLPYFGEHLDYSIVDSELKFSLKTDERRLWGLVRSLVNNAVIGVSKGWSKKMNLVGVGYKAQIKGSVLFLSLGYSHDIAYPIPHDIKISCETPTSILVFGADKQKVGLVSAEIRGFRPPEPYKGKGVIYGDEKVLRKEGKKK